MQLKFTPRISGKFTDLILRQKRVQEALHNVDSEEERHNIAKTILIEGFSKFKIDINEIINLVKDD